MNKNDKNNWFYCKSYKEMGKSLCPRCDEHFPFGPLFDHHKRQCQYCKASLIEWVLEDMLILIDIERAPEIVVEIVNYLDDLMEPEAQQQLEELIILFRVKP